MKRYQRGTATLDIAITLTFGLLLFGILNAGLISPLKNYARAAEINHTVLTLTQAATRYYGSDVMQQRCLTPSKPLTLTRLINDHYLDSAITQRSERYNVRYHYRTITPAPPHRPWTRPSRIEVDVTFTTSSEMNAILGHVSPHSITANTLYFTAPLSNDITASWSHFTPETGCLQ